MSDDVKRAASAPPADPTGDSLLQLAARGDPLLLESMRKRVLAGEPTPYVAGFLHFRCRRFRIDRRAYITDPEASGVLDVAAGRGCELEQTLGRPLRVVEFGIGAGTLSITLKLECPRWDVTGIDIDPSALELAKENASDHRASITLLNSNFFSAWPGDRPAPDLIFGDPPWGSESDLYEPERDAEYYRQMPPLSAFPPGGSRTALHDQLLSEVSSRGWKSLLVLNYGILPEPVIQHSAKRLTLYRIIHPAPGLSVLVGNF